MATRAAEEVRGNRLAFRVSDAERKWLMATAFDLDCSISWVLRRLITDARRQVAWPLPGYVSGAQQRAMAKRATRKAGGT